MVRKTKICCTIGPASTSEKTIAQLIGAGMDVARLNFSHGTQEEHAKAITLIRRAAEQAGVPVAIMQDLQGPKLRIGRVPGGAMTLRRGQEVILSASSQEAAPGTLSTPYLDLPKDVRPGDKILIDDGLVQLKVLGTKGPDVRCRVLEGGTVTSHKGINLPGVNVSSPTLTEKDRADLLFGLAHGVDYVAVSFVRRAADVQAVREIIAQHNAPTSVVAKIEKPQALAELEEIIAVSDAVIVARGDLGVELPLEQVPMVQRQVVQSCRQAGVPCIVATQMLESMRTNPRPTRAEVTDVANAIGEGVDALMLTAETATGARPVEVTATLARIVRTSEAHAPFSTAEGSPQRRQKHSVADAVADSACRAASDLKARAIVTLTQSGYTARMIAKYRPGAPIIAFTPEVTTQRLLQLVWGVRPLVLPFTDDLHELLELIDARMCAARLAAPGDVLVVVMGFPIPRRGTTNLLTVHRVHG
ncbi:MAG: pyruvate kinase [candidate division KSB1 bacterium]|nr:pyruvate kinase [candidate division KSB1 bacterium]MDZ7294244.1 pyruvate kinase [candidate division KSB1 bacterium]MDZ7378188.1 pyruvate kinase [candidate division KSB1 bacterium]MDZ7385459.1 pyruvate kinase [candidate division KSB1 bacterium]MDZ7391810.1 pyruvate kinase [candidate division KSB1 bacterium]